MKVAFYIPVLNVGGAEKVIVNLLKQLSINEENKYYLITDSINSLWIDKIDNKINILNVDSKRNIFIRLFNIFKVLRSNNIDIVISHLTHSNIHSLLLKCLSNFKLILVEHSITSYYIESHKNLSFRISKLLIRYLYKYADSIVCVSKACQNDLVKKFNIKIKKTKVIYNPIDFDSINILAPELLPFEIIEFIGERRFLVSIGRLEALKNHQFLIHSLKNYLIENDLVLLIIGDGAEKRKLQNLINYLSLNKNVLLVGYDLNPYKFLSKCKLLIHPSKFEGFGLVLIEALFLQKQVISFNFEAAYEVLDNGTLGSIVNDKSSLISALDYELNRVIDQKSKKELSERLFNDYNLVEIAKHYNDLINYFKPDGYNKFNTTK